MMKEGEEIEPFSMQARAKRLFERILMLAVILAVIHFVEDFIFDTPAIWIVDLLVVLVALLSYHLHRRNHELIARIIAYVLITAIIFYFAAGTHARNGIQWHFLSIIVITIIIFADKNPLLGIVLVSFVFGLLILLELNNYYLNWFPEIGETERSIISVIINITSSVVILVYAVYSLIQSSVVHEERITREMEKVQKLNKELDSFVYSASHDLKAPLSSLRGLLTLAKMEKQPAMLEEYFTKMDSTISQSENFIKNITDYSRNVRLEPRPVEINFKSFIEDLFQDISFINGVQPVRLELAIEEETIFADQNRMQAIFGNLLSNSLRYSDPRKGDSWIKISLTKKSQTYLIQVEDNGCGIEAVHLPHLFDMFYRANESSKGSGLGLYIVSESIQRLEGSIEVSTEVNKWTKFNITIPAPKG